MDAREDLTYNPSVLLEGAEAVDTAGVREAIELYERALVRIQFATQVTTLPQYPSGALGANVGAGRY